MALSKANKAILKAKYGDKLYELLVNAENVVVSDGESLADKLAALPTEMRTIAAEVLASSGKLERKIVDSLEDIKPGDDGADKYIYMVPRSGGKNGNQYDEYMVIGGAVEKVGDWEVDLSNYVQKDGEKVLSTNDYTTEDKQAVAASKTVTDKLSGNADVLSGITPEQVTAWNGKGTVYVSAAQPEGLKNGDLWLQTFEE